MHPPEGIRVIGIFGRGLTGKTMVARELGGMMDLPVRHCGELVKNRAGELGVALEELPVHEHRSVDDETRAIADRTNGLVVEGRFLDQVLSGISGLYLVRLECSDAERLLRLQRRYELAPTEAAAARVQQDSAEEDLRNLLFARPRLRASISLRFDTTELTAAASAALIADALARR